MSSMQDILEFTVAVIGRRAYNVLCCRSLLELSSSVMRALSGDIAIPFTIVKPRSFFSTSRES